MLRKYLRCSQCDNAIDTYRLNENEVENVSDHLVKFVCSVCNADVESRIFIVNNSIQLNNKKHNIAMDALIAIADPISILQQISDDKKCQVDGATAKITAHDLLYVQNVANKAIDAINQLSQPFNDSVKEPSLNDFQFSTKALNILRLNEIKTVDSLLNTSDEQLRQFKFMSDYTFSECQNGRVYFRKLVL
jgi:hypothetical protein